MNISYEQLRDATGTYSEVARYEGVAFNKTDKQLTTPSFLEIKYALGIDDNSSTIVLTAADAAKLWIAPNARVMVGINTQRGSVLLPGVVLPDSTDNNVRFGCLYAPEDVRGSSKDDACANLTSYQQLLLAKIVAEHQPAVGSHEADNRVNGAEIGHAVIAAAMTNPENIHSTVHSLVESKKFSAELSQRGITDVRVDGKIRQNLEQVFTTQQIAGVVIVESHQVQFPIADEFDVSAGFTLVAQQSRGQAPDLAANLAKMASS